MANRYLVGTGNWNATSGVWSDTSGGAAGSFVPGSGDVAVLNGGSGTAYNVTLTASVTCQAVDGTGHTGTLALGIYTLTVTTGTTTLPSTMTAVTGTGNLTLSAPVTLVGGCASVSPVVLISGTTGTYTIDTNGGTWTTLTISGSPVRTIDLDSTLTVGTLSIIGTGNTTFTGAFNIAVTNVYATSGVSTAAVAITLVAGQTLTVATLLKLSCPYTYTLTLLSGTGSSDTFLHFNGDAADCRVFGVTFTDVNCAHAIDNWHGGTLTRTTGITNRTSADIGATDAEVATAVWAYESRTLTA